MAKKITNPDTYLVEIREPYWEDATKDGAPGMALVLPGYCEIDGEEKYINGKLYFKSTIIQGGKNQGKSLYEVSIDTLIQLGMSTPFSPEKRTELEGKLAKFVVQEDEYKGKTTIKVAFINPPGKEAIEDNKAKEIFEALKSDTPEDTNTPFDEEDDDEIPF